MKVRDLNMTYEAALHGVQSAIKYELEKQHPRMDSREINRLKHLRVGIDARAADANGLVMLLISKGVFTPDEYAEFMRLAMNEELARYTDHIRETYGLPPHISFG